MNRPGKSVSSLIIAGISLLLVGGALITTLAQSGFSPTPYTPPTNTSIQVESPLDQEPDADSAETYPSSTTESGQSETPESTQTEAPLEETSTPPSSQTAQTTPSPTSSEGTTCEPPSDWIKYTVKSGDTLYSIAVLFQTTYQTLQRGNCTWSNRIYPGETLYVPDNATITPTKRPTKAPTKTSVPTNTPQPTDTPAPTPTFTNTPSPTNTLTPVPSETPSVTPTPTDAPTATTETPA